MASTENKGKATGAYSSVLSCLINYSDPLSTSKLVTSELSVCLSKVREKKSCLVFCALRPELHKSISSADLHSCRATPLF